MRSTLPLTYPGTNIPLIRGGAPDPAPNGGAPPSGGAPPKADPPAPGPKASGDGKPSGDPAPSRNWEKDYNELQPKYERYEKIGTPEQIEQVIGDWRSKRDQLNQIAQDFKDGKLTYAQAQAAKRDVEQGPTDPWAGYDELEDGRPRAERLLSILEGRFGDLTKKQMDEIRAEVKTISSNLGTQMKLAWKLMRLQQSNPNLDIDAVIDKATKASGYTPEQIIDLIYEQELAPQRQQDAIAAAVEKAKAEIRAEYENKRVPPVTHRMPRLAAKDDKPGSQAERQDKVFGSFMERLNQSLDKERQAS